MRIEYLYIHIPFCIRKCIYCDFFSVPYDETLAERYIAAVTQELIRRREIAGELKTVYIGGGTPTTLPEEQFIKLFSQLKKFFRISPDAEITIEVNPGTIDLGMARTLIDIGINRFSIGIQSFNDRELQLLERIHSSAEGIKAISTVRTSGVKNVSIDLIYGIPGQTFEDWSHTISRAIEFFPEHISAYELTPERGTPLYELITQKRLEKPDEEAIVGMYYHAMDRLADTGYIHYEISNFARYGFECRHNLNYWNRGQYIGIGAGAHSFIGDKRIRNTGDMEKYMEVLEKGDLAIEESNEISCEDAIKESIFLGLRKTEGLNIKEFREDLGIDIVRASRELIDEGLLISDGEHLRLTRKGIVVCNTVITKLFEMLELN